MLQSSPLKTSCQGRVIKRWQDVFEAISPISNWMPKWGVSQRGQGEALGALGRDKDNAALQGELVVIQQDLTVTKCKRTKQKSNIGRLVQRENKYCNSLRKMVLGGTREFAQAHQQLLGIDAMAHPTTAADGTGGSRAIP